MVSTNIAPFLPNNRKIVLIAPTQSFRCDATSSRSRIKTKAAHHSSSRKRKRSIADDINASEVSEAARSQTRVGRSSASAKVDNGEVCWHCSANPTNICHVIGQKDKRVRAYPLYTTRGGNTKSELVYIKSISCKFMSLVEGLRVIDMISDA
jgi:hypothetical protein